MAKIEAGARNSYNKSDNLIPTIKEQTHIRVLSH